jgi:hypothetical protein
MGRYIQTPERDFNPGLSDTKRFYGSGQYRIFSSSGTWTVPLGVSTVRVSALGAGGGGGGHWFAHENSIGCLSGFCTTNFMGSWSIAGNGGGGAYTVGVASVTPGCVCCVVVGACGTTRGICVYWQCPGSGCQSTCCAACTIGSLCGLNGGDGGFSCALGICAPGGKGGTGGRCGCGGLDPTIWCVTTNWSTYCSCTCAGCSGCICGGAGGSGSNGFVNYCGGSGTAGGWCECGSNRLLNCTKQFGCAGAAGSPLGHGEGPVVPNVFNSLAFDGSTDSEAFLISKYDLPYPRWCGQIIYTQAPGTLGAPGNNTCVCCTCGTGCCGTSGYCCIFKSKWNAPCAGFCCCFIDSNNWTVNCNSSIWSCAGLGAGGMHCAIGAQAYYDASPGNGACGACGPAPQNNLSTSSCGTRAGNGEVILEW